MFTLWTDFDRAIFRNPWRVTRQLGRLADEAARAPVGWNQRMNLIDKGEAFELVAELPGIKESELDLTVQHDVLTLRAERAAVQQEGLLSHRQERGAYRVQRSLSLPVPVDPEQTKAVLKDGVLRVTMAKSAAHQPRHIAVRTD